mmetsp:Transcript_26787/g.36899  ORF Transcript_26787/g.36899 Transcript_26787/m.36899 type:complete len:310 (+) Transcript_26787:205-1134(+)
MAEATVSVKKRRTFTASLPKAVLYREILALLPFYKQVFFVDEDVSLQDFDITTFLHRVGCSFGANGPPLIAQPLVRESTFSFTFLNYDAWKSDHQNFTLRRYSVANNTHRLMMINGSMTSVHRGDFYNSVNDSYLLSKAILTPSTVVASEVLIIESLATLVDSQFLDWLIRRVLSHTYDLSLRLGVDWGLSRLWCTAAQAYQSRVLNTSFYDEPIASLTNVSHSNHNYFFNNHHSSDLSKRAVSCAVITGHNTVRHHHKDELMLKLFPNWFLLDTQTYVDPLRNGVAMYGLKFVLNSSSEQCMSTATSV